MREPKFVSAMRNRGVAIIYVGPVALGGRRYLVWQRGSHGWDAVLYTPQGRSVNVLNYGLGLPPTAADTEKAVHAFGAHMLTRPMRRRRSSAAGGRHKFGEQTACAKCGQDIEYHGNRRYIYSADARFNGQPAGHICYGRTATECRAKALARHPNVGFVVTRETATDEQIAALEKVGKL